MSEVETCKTFQENPGIWDPTADIFQDSAIERGRVCMSESYDVYSHDLCVCTISMTSTVCKRSPHISWLRFEPQNVTTELTPTCYH